jgi:hypothetical protein
MLHSRQLALQYVNHKSTIVNYNMQRGKTFVPFRTIRMIRHLNKESIGGDGLSRYHIMIGGDGLSRYHIMIGGDSLSPYQIMITFQIKCFA